MSIRDDDGIDGMGGQHRRLRLSGGGLKQERVGEEGTRTEEGRVEFSAMSIEGYSSFSIAPAGPVKQLPSLSHVSI